MSTLGPRAGGLRLMRLVLVAVCLGTSVNSVTTVLLFRANAALTRDTRTLTLRAGHDGRVTTAALCALRHDLEVRVHSSRGFLAEHPHGIPGISAKIVRDGIANQERTITALAGIACK